MRAQTEARAASTARLPVSTTPCHIAFSGTRTRASRRAHAYAISREPSVDTSSTITSSKSANVWPRRLSTLASRCGAAL
jgi:hypothetical protein